MENETLRQLYGRKSVRVFTDQPMEEDIVQAILLAATMAPTAGNQQLYTILRITDPALLARLADSCDHQPFIAKGKLVLVFCADCLKWYDAFLSAGCEPRKPGPGDLLLAVDDALIAAQNAVVAAESLGVGSCYIGDITENYEFHRELLNLPQYVAPAAMLCFGYPTRQQQERAKPVRFRLEDMVHENGYHAEKAAQMPRMLSGQTGKTGDELADWIRRFCKRKWNSDFSREMSRSCARIAAHWCGNKE